MPDQRDQRSTWLSSIGGIVILASISCALWGSAFAFVKLGYQLFHVSADNPAQQILFAGMRFTLAGFLVIAGVSIARGKLALPTRDDIVPIALLSLCQTTLQYAPFYLGLAHAQGINASLIEGTSTFIGIVVAALVFKQEKLTLRKLCGCLLGFAGVALVVLRGGGSVGAFTLRGEGLVLASLIAVAFSACLIRDYGANRDPVMLAGWQFVVGGLTLSALGLLFGARLSVPSPAAAAVLLYLAALSAIAYSLWSLLLKHNPVSRVAMFEFLIPVFGVIFSTIFLGERLQGGQLASVIVALALIVAGTVVVYTGKDGGN
ncbi:MAG: DMT family transporter [Atopobiaceae bacterium]|nr:DMT family transporter [Atopobiaceae bacterium]